MHVIENIVKHLRIQPGPRRTGGVCPSVYARAIGMIVNEQFKSYESDLGMT